ncbi:uncharacterized protein Pyn_26596 [Prunus yedoensis var. nudiflora]|uniref:Aminotransferase-like plant mobile domain-containing protein n=1 Tax=Prunus yedoensis var. nudiflora TaxID=2094558 RepID=A0A314ZAV3_PRUYE|nr:uncharacterized protein Pyn_26596 [Prunus yedoensis var. nudiflora]
MDDGLKVGGPLLPLEEACENPVVGNEPLPEILSVVDPASVSRCCIEKGLFPAVPLFFQYPCSISKGWSEWVDRELLDPSTCDILRRAQVLDAIFLSKLWDIHIEAKMLRHVVRRWSTATHTFICSWGEFTPTLKDVANITRLPVCGDRSPFDIALTPAKIYTLAVLRKGAPTLPSTSLRFSNWIQYFGDVNRRGPWRLVAFISLWLGRLLDQCQILEKNAAGTMGVETLLNSGFLQVFLWEHLRGWMCAHSLIRVLCSLLIWAMVLSCRKVSLLSASGLLDDIEYFIFCPYDTLAETFTFVPFYADVDDTVEVPAVMSQGFCFIRYSLLNAACLPLPTLGDSRSEISVTYSPHRVRRQLGLDQGVPANPDHGDPFLLHRVFWSNCNIPDSVRPPFLAGKRRVDGFSTGYQAYWNRCLASLREFQSSPCDRLPPTTARLTGLVSEEKAVPLSVKRNLPFISKSGDIVGEFSKTKQRSGTQSSCSSGKRATPASGKRKQEEKPSAKKEQTVGKPRRFIPKVASSGPPRTKEVTPPARPQPSKPTASEG